MRNLFATIVIGFVFTSNAAASHLSTVADSLLDAAPDLYTLPELLAAWDDKESAETRDKRASDRVSAIKVMLGKYEDSQNAVEKATLLYEIGKLHMDQATYLQTQAITRYAADLDRWRIGEILEKPTPNESIVKDELLAISNKLRDFNANFSRDPRIGEVNWMIASAMSRTGNEHFGQYLKQAEVHPKSGDFAVLAKLTQADWLANLGKLEEAATAYDAIRKEQIAEHLKGYATYRLGWTYLIRAIKDLSKARDEYLKKADAAFQLTLKIAKEDSKTRFRLREAALRDLIWTWAWFGLETAPMTYLEKEGLQDKIPELRRRRAEELLRKGEIEQAAEYYNALIAKDPELRERPDIHLKLAHAYIAAGDIQGMRNQIEQLVKISTDKKDDWYDEHEDDKELMTRVTKMHQLLPTNAGFRMIEVANAQTDSKRRKEILTAAIYELATQAEKTTDEQRKLAMRVAIVQGQIELEKFNEALAQLDAIVALGEKAGDYREKAAFERINILAKQMEAEPQPQLPPPGEVKKPIPLSALRTKFAIAANDYLHITPKAENALNLRYQIAQDLFSYGHYKEAMPLFEGIAQEYPREDLGKSSIEIIVSMALKNENWDEVIRLSTSFLNNRDVRGKKLRDFLKQSLDWAKSQKPA